MEKGAFRKKEKKDRERGWRVRVVENLQLNRVEFLIAFKCDKGWQYLLRSGKLASQIFLMLNYSPYQLAGKYIFICCFTEIMISLYIVSL